ncbi:6444_t:CDS:2, partial [Racocetra persica]
EDETRSKEEEYATKKEILDAAQANAKKLGFAVVIKSSSSRHLHLQCKCSGQPRNNWNLTIDTRQRKRMSKCCECPYLIKAVPNKLKWSVVEIVNEHNHSMAKEARAFYEHRQLTRDTRHIAVTMLKAGAKPSMVYEAIRDENKDPTATRKDISNLSTRIHTLEETASMGALITGMEERGYDIHRETYQGKYFYITFDIAGAWISNESEKSYTWVIEQLALFVFLDIFPLVFVTDNNSALINALGKVFPKSEHLLCTWHIVNNFKKNLRKYFNDSAFDEFIKTVENFIYSRDREELNAAMADYRKLASLSSNEKEVLRYLN